MFEPVELPQPTPEQLTQQAMRESVLRIADEFQRQIAYVWSNPHGLSPQQVLNCYGTDAMKLFQLSNVIAEQLTLNGIGDFSRVVPEGWTYAINPDGTVTVTQQEQGQ